MRWKIWMTMITNHFVIPGVVWWGLNLSTRCINYLTFTWRLKIWRQKRIIGVYFEGLDRSHFSKGVEMLPERWAKCIQLDGDYII